MIPRKPNTVILIFWFFYGRQLMIVFTIPKRRMFKLNNISSNSCVFQIFFKGVHFWSLTEPLASLNGKIKSWRPLWCQIKELSEKLVRIYWRLFCQCLGKKNILLVRSNAKHILWEYLMYVHLCGTRIKFWHQLIYGLAFSQSFPFFFYFPPPCIYYIHLVVSESQVDLSLI